MNCRQHNYQVLNNLATYLVFKGLTFKDITLTVCADRSLFLSYYI